MAQDNTSTSSANTGASQTSNAEQLIKTIISPQSQLITVHLDENNYLLWKFQVETAIEGYGLEGFVYGTTPIPPKFVTVIPNYSDLQQADIERVAADAHHHHHSTETSLSNNGNDEPPSLATHLPHQLLLPAPTVLTQPSVIIQFRLDIL